MKLSGKRGPSRGKDEGGEKELRLQDEPDLGSSLALPLTKYVTLGKLLSLSELQFQKAVTWK